MEQVLLGICDDQPEVLCELQKMLCGICDEIGLNNEICAFSDGHELLEQIERFQVVFLDIEMPQMDGIELGKQIKEKNPGCKIVMATGMVERFKEAFQIRALRFVTKPFVRDEVKEALEAAVEGIFFTKSIEVYAGRNKYELPEEKIAYIRAYNGYSELYAVGKTFRRESSLSELEAVLNEKMFVRINREVIVNLSMIREYGGAQIKTEDREFYVSRRRRKEFEKKYMEYDLKH